MCSVEHTNSEKETKIINWERSFVHHRIVSTVYSVGLVSDRISYISLRGHWCNISIVNLQAPGEEKSDDSKDRFYEELEQVFNHFHKYHMKILFGDFNANVWRENIFKPAIENESQCQDNNVK
jgi:hypothetical protein